MRWLLFGALVSCTPGCATVEAVSGAVAAWFSSPDGAEVVAEGIFQMVTGNVPGGIWTILSGLGATGVGGYKVYKRLKRVRAQLEEIEPETEPTGLEGHG